MDGIFPASIPRVPFLKPSNLEPMKLESTSLDDIKTLRRLLWELTNTNGRPPRVTGADIDRATAALDRIERRSLPWWRRIFTAAPLLLVLVLCASGCTATKSATRALDSAGYRDVTFTGSAWWCCNGSWFSDGFRAVGPTGIPVEGCVCRGLLKGSTIRTK